MKLELHTRLATHNMNPIENHKMSGQIFLTHMSHIIYIAQHLYWDKDSFITLDRDLLKRANFFDNLSPLFKFELL